MATRSVAPYERSVFINCPFDDDYKPLFGYIDECQYSMHDLNHIQKLRLNMVFECMLVFGAKQHQEKDLLMLVSVLAGSLRQAALNICKAAWTTCKSGPTSACI